MSVATTPARHVPELSDLWDEWLEDPRASVGGYAFTPDAVYIVLPRAGLRAFALAPAKNDLTGASWTLSGTVAAPTLRPSLHIRGVWHGWMTDGELVEV